METMENSEADAETLRSIVQCCICQGTFVDPRVLPCLHSFCLNCIQGAGSNRPPGSRMPCPLCRTEFTIPDEDFSGLQKDFRLKNLLEISNSSFKFQESGSADKSEQLAQLESVFCFDCQTATSVRNHFDFHRSHNCCDVVTAVTQLQNVVANDEVKVVAWESEVLERMETIEAEREAFVQELNHTKRSIKKRSEELQILIDTHIRALEKDLEKLESSKVEEMEAEEQVLDTQLLKIRRFGARCRRLSSQKKTALPGDTCRSATELHSEAERLKRKQVKMRNQWNSSRSTEPQLEMTQLEPFLTANNNNLVGNFRGQQRQSRRLRLLPLRAVFGALWRMTGLSDTRIQISAGVGLVAGLLAMATLDVFIGIAIALFMTVSLFVLLRPLLPRTNTMRVMASFRRHDRHSSGVTYLRHHVYVLFRLPSSVAVIPDEAPFILSGEIPLPQVTQPCDLASCHVTNSLYITDSGKQCVWKLTLDNRKLICWLRNLERPYTLSVSSDGRVLTVREGRPFSSLEVYDSNAVMVSTIRLPSLVTEPYHSVETSRGTFVVSHGTWLAQTHGLVEVDRDGVVLNSYSSTECFWGVMNAIFHLLEPTPHYEDDARHLAIDFDDRVFLAEWFNDRVMQIDPGFRSHRIHLTSPAYGLGWPIMRLCYVKETRQMLIVHLTSKGSKVNIYKMH